MASNDRPQTHGAIEGIDTERFVDCGPIAALNDEQQAAAREGIETYLAEYRERHPTGAIPDNPTTTAVVEGLATAITEATASIVVGDRRLDRERDGGEVVVVAVHDVDAEKYDVLATEQTVAEHNPEYPGEDQVIEAVYVDSLPEWFDPDNPEHDLTQLAEKNEGIARLHGIDTDTYAFPESRLAPVESVAGRALEDDG